MSPTKQRTILMYTIGGLFMAVALVILFLFATSATLTVTTNSGDNQILIRQKLQDRSNQIDVHQNGRTAEVRVSAGTYIVSIINNQTNSSVQQVVTLGIAEHKSLNLTISETSSTSKIEPVSTFGAGSVTVSKDLLRFIDRNAAERPLYSVNAANVVTKLDANNIYQTVKWSDPTFGIGLVLNKNNHYAITKIQDSSISTVKLPFNASATTSFATTPSKAWFVSNRKTVYKANADGSFTEVYKTSDVVDVLTASDKAVLLAQKKENSTREGNLIILHNNGDKYQIEGEAYEAAWSPSGDRLVTSGDTSELFDSKFNKIGVLTDGNFNSPVWLDNDTLLYGVSNKLWQYNFKTGSSNILVAVDKLTGIFSQISPSVDKDYIYTSIQKGGDRPTIVFRLDRIPLQSTRQVTIPSEKLSLLIPNTISGCSVNYLNFTSFALILKPGPQASNCVNATRDYLSGYTVDSSGMLFQQLN